MIIILVRTLILYIAVLISMRIMGKAELSEMQPFEIVVTLMIAELASLPMEDTNLPLLNGIIAIITIVFMQVLISYLNLKSERVRGIICGKPSILITKGVINEKELKKLRININDLMEQLRIKDYPLISDVEFAILETNGEMSVIPKANKRPVTVEDIQINSIYEGIPISLIIDGYINYDNLHISGKNKDWLIQELQKQGVSSENEVLFAYIDSHDTIYIQKKDDN